MGARKKQSGSTPAVTALNEAGIVFTEHAYAHGRRAVREGTQSFGLEAAGELGLDPSHVFKTLVADVDGHPWLAMVPVSGRLDAKALARATGGKRARLCRPDEAQRATGGVIGAISPIGQRCGAVLDTDAMTMPWVYVSGGRRGLDIGLAPADLVRITGAVIADIFARPPE